VNSNNVAKKLCVRANVSCVCAYGMPDMWGISRAIPVLGDNRYLHAHMYAYVSMCMYIHVYFYIHVYWCFRRQQGIYMGWLWLVDSLKL